MSAGPVPATALTMVSRKPWRATRPPITAPAATAPTPCAVTRMPVVASSPSSTLTAIAGMSAMNGAATKVLMHIRVNDARSPGSARTRCQPPSSARRKGSCAASGSGGGRATLATAAMAARKLTVLMASAHVMLPRPMATAAATGPRMRPRFHCAEASPMAAGRSSGGTRCRNDAW